MWLALARGSACVVALGLAATSGCKRSSDEKVITAAPLGVATAPTRSLSFQAAVNVEAGRQKTPLPMLWRRASSLDPQDLAVLGESEGALELLRVGRAGGLRGWVALSALPWAPDAAEAQGALCQLLREVRLSERLSVLRLVHQVASAPRPGAEVQSQPGRTCRRIIDQMEKLTKEEQDWAASISSYLHD